jgi:hypothetical protein
LLVVGGVDLFDAELQRYDLCDGSRVRVGDLRRYSALSAAGGHVVVANAVTGPDRISLLKGEDLAPLGGLGMVGGVSPSVSSNGTVAFREVTELDQAEAFHVSVWSPDRPNEKRVVARANVPLSPVAFGSGDMLAVVANSDEFLKATQAPTLTLYNVVSGAAAEQTELPLRVVRGLAWGEDSPVLAVSGEDDEQGVLLNKDTLAVTGQIPAGYSALAFTPGGRQLLLTKGAGQPGGSGQLALFTIEGQTLEALPEFPGGSIGGADWP